MSRSVIICGSRHFVGDDYWFHRIVRGLHHCDATEVVSGTCRGADLYGEYVARMLSIPVKRFPANWKPSGPAGPTDYGAGPKRNRQMGEYVGELGAVIALPPVGRGTASMIRIAEELGIETFVLSDERST